MSLFSTRICAGIVTYNPDIDLLVRCIVSIKEQVSRVIIVDNNSHNIDQVRVICSREDVVLLSNERNVGIAKALNQIANEAKFHGCDWFLTLDQDSVCNPNMISNYMESCGNSNVGLVCPQILFRKSHNIDIEGQTKAGEVDVAITSGSLVRMEAWENVKGFWDYLFIDKVDEDFCYALRECGWIIIKVYEVALEHEIGQPVAHHFMGKTYYTDSYPAFRYYYIARNSIVVNHVHIKVNYKLGNTLLKRFFKIVLGENNKFQKLSNFLKGVRDGVIDVRNGIKRDC